MMSRLAIWVEVEAKPGKEQMVADFLKSAQPLAEKEPGTVTWYAVKLGGAKFGISIRWIIYLGKPDGNWSSGKRKGAIARPSPSVTKGNSFRAFSRSLRENPQKLKRVKKLHRLSKPERFGPPAESASDHGTYIPIALVGGLLEVMIYFTGKRRAPIRIP
jgi:hypothetical protein